MNKLETIKQVVLLGLFSSISAYSTDVIAVYIPPTSNIIAPKAPLTINWPMALAIMSVCAVVCGGLLLLYMKYKNKD